MDKINLKYFELVHDENIDDLALGWMRELVQKIRQPHHHDEWVSICLDAVIEVPTSITDWEEGGHALKRVRSSCWRAVSRMSRFGELRYADHDGRLGAEQ